ncbi:MAG: DUF3833 family protein [Gammaproteobacteria bacterium]
MNKAALLPAFLLLAGCSSMSAQDYEGSAPTMDMLEYFSGQVHAWGVVQSRSGKVLRRFTLKMQGAPQADGSLAMHEDLDYVDGGHETRDWSIHRLDAHHVQATANGIVGTADGEQYGDTLHLVYTLQVPMDGKTREFKVDDWFYLQADGVLVNRSYGSKWGFHAFDVLTFFQKVPAAG